MDLPLCGIRDDARLPLGEVEAAEIMSKGHIRKLAGTALCASVFYSASVFAEGGSKESGKEVAPLNLARLEAVLRAASERKQSGDEITLKKPVYLRGRPTGAAAEGSLLPAGTIVRKSKRQIVNASGIWHHIETREGNDGWIHDFELAPE